MKEFIKKTLGISMLSSFIFITLGLMLLIFSNMTISLVAFVIGLFIIIGSFNYLIKYVKKDSNSFDLFCFIIMLILGLIVMFKYDFFAGILPFIIGLIVLFNSISKLQLSLELKNSNGNWIVPFILSIVGIILGVMFIFNPFKGALVITKAIGIYMIIYGIIDIIECLSFKKNIKTVSKKTRIIDEK